jgi:hypothetical protein
MTDMIWSFAPWMAFLGGVRLGNVYSAGGAMALCIAQSTRRAVGVVTGGFSPSPPTPGVLRQLDRRLDPDHPSRSLW